MNFKLNSDWPWPTMVKLLWHRQGPAMVDHGKGTCWTIVSPNLHKKASPLRILVVVVVVKRWRHRGNSLRACRIAVISLLHFTPNCFFSTLYTATQQLLRKKCDSGRVNNWKGLQINQSRSRYEIIKLKKLLLLKSIRNSSANRIIF